MGRNETRRRRSTRSEQIQQLPGVIYPKVKPPPGRRVRRTNQLVYLFKTVMPVLFQHKDAHFFMKPVNPEKLQLPSYCAYIKEPMDLGTIRDRLKNKYYWSASECIRDFQRMICNAIIYQEPGSQVVNEAHELEAIFMVRLIDMPKAEEERVPKSNLGAGNATKLASLQKGAKPPMKLRICTKISTTPTPSMSSSFPISTTPSSSL